MKLLCLILLSFTLISCKKEEDIRPSTTECIGHRGDREGSLENSMAGFISASLSGAAGFELDVQDTKDHRTVVFHDATLTKLARSKPGKQCKLDAKISDLTLSELHDNCELIDGQRIPTFVEVMTYFKNSGLKIFVDIKGVPGEEVYQVIREQYEGHYQDIIALITFAGNARELYRVRNQMPNGVKLLLTDDTFLAGSENGFDGVDVRLISDLQIRMLQDKGMMVTLFAVNDEAATRHAMQMKVAYLTTDNLSVCLAVKKR